MLFACEWDDRSRLPRGSGQLPGAEGARNCRPASSWKGSILRHRRRSTSSYQARASSSPTAICCKAAASSQHDGVVNDHWSQQVACRCWSSGEPGCRYAAADLWLTSAAAGWWHETNFWPAAALSVAAGLWLRGCGCRIAVARMSPQHRDHGMWAVTLWQRLLG